MKITLVVIVGMIFILLPWLMYMTRIVKTEVYICKTYGTNHWYVLSPFKRMQIGREWYKSDAKFRDLTKVNVKWLLMTLCSWIIGVVALVVIITV